MKNSVLSLVTLVSAFAIFASAMPYGVGKGRYIRPLLTDKILNKRADSLDDNKNISDTSRHAPNDINFTEGTMASLDTDTNDSGICEKSIDTSIGVLVSSKVQSGDKTCGQSIIVIDSETKKQYNVVIIGTCASEDTCNGDINVPPSTAEKVFNGVNAGNMKIKYKITDKESNNLSSMVDPIDDNTSQELGPVFSRKTLLRALFPMVPKIP
jgi:hypothetical protein